MSSSSGAGNAEEGVRSPTEGDNTYLCQCGKLLNSKSPYCITEHEKSDLHVRWVASNKGLSRITNFFAKRPRVASEDDGADVNDASSNIGGRGVDAQGRASVPSSVSASSRLVGDAILDIGGRGAETSATPCPGFLVEGVPRHRSGGTFMDNYPTRLQDRGWRVDTEGSGWSLRCVKVSSAGGPCVECERIPFLREWKSMVTCCQRVAAEGPGRVVNQYLSRMALEAKFVELSADRDRLRLHSLNEARKTWNLEKGISTYQRFARCIATRDVKRTRQIVSACGRE
eukprot:GHVU01037500.1.p1 GENE.GHVU01037500.1~~GHVU01037500.1.p1  ORF type:complete len:285 (-),score=28.27 GHVU01037500.1:38-892(-)